jgi:NADH-quinone oxidoreductase subunit K
MQIPSWVTQIGVSHYLMLTAVLFSIGLLTVLIRKNALVVLMGIELMLNAVNLSFIAFSKHNDKINGQVMVFFVMTIAAAEAAVGLALIVSIFKKYKEVNLRQFEKLKG